MDQYISAMVKMQTSGMDITILMVCEMLNISVVMLIKDFMWKSHDVDLGDDRIVYLLMFRGGRCVSARNKNGNKFGVKLPDCVIEILREPIQTTDNTLDTSTDFEIEENASINKEECLKMAGDVLGGEF